MASLKKKISGEVICSRYQRALLGFWARLRILSSSAGYVIKLYINSMLLANQSNSYHSHSNSNV